MKSFRKIPLLILPYHAAKFENNLKNKSWDIGWHNSGPQLGQNCLFGAKRIFWKISMKWLLSTYCALSFQKVWKKSSLGQNRAKIVYLSHRGLFGIFHLHNFYLLIPPYHSKKIEKILRADPEVWLAQFWITIEPKLPIQPKQGVLGKFLYLFCPLMLQSLKIILKTNPETKACIILGHNWAKIVHLVQRGLFWKFPLNDFYLLIVPCHAAVSKKKKSLEWILRYRLV